MATSLRCDIALLPAIDLAQKALVVSRQLAERHDTLYTLQETTCFPHVSLYMTQFKLSDMGKIRELLGTIAAKVPPCSVSVTGYVQKRGYLDAEYNRTSELAHVQMAVVEALNPLRDGLSAPDQARLTEATGKILENIEKYGYRGVGELFRPHLSLTRFADGQLIDVSELPDPRHFDGQCSRLGMFEMGDNGTCVRKLAEFDLRG
jgi:hypothetical protein